jgi:hypothetical protein
LIKKKYHCWACDYSKESGEGQLARLFIEKNFSNSEIEIFTDKSINSKFKFLNNFLKHKYISPFVGIAFNWIFYLQKKNVVYINYLPLWNFFIFLLVPPKTILGPITGGSLHSSKNIIRKYIFPIFYFISKIIISLRFEKLNFSTDLLKVHFNNTFIKKNFFNYVLKKIKKENRIRKKNIDFLIYYRKHNNKIYNFPYKLIKRIKSFGFRIHVIGDKLNIAGVRNHGYQKNHAVKKLLSKSRFSICSQENLFTLFVIECINFNVKVLVDKSFENKTPRLAKIKKSFFFIDFQKNNINKKVLSL